MSKGCTIGLIVMAVIVVIIIVGAVLVYMNRDKIFEAGISYLVDAVETELASEPPEGYTAESIHELLAEFKIKIKNQELDPATTQKLAGGFREALADEEFDQEEKLQMLHLIEEAVGRSPAEMEEEFPDTLEIVPDSA